MSRISIFFGLASLGLEFWLAGILLKTRLCREFPLFFSYIAAFILGDIVKFSLVHNYRLYFYAYWTIEILYAGLGVAALFESYHRVFHNFYRVHRWFWTLFPAAIALVVLLSAYYARTRPPRQAFPLISLIISLEIGVNLIRTAIFLLFRGAMLFFHARRRSYPLGIVDGFAVLAVAGLMYGLRSEFGTKVAFLVQYGIPVAYILALTVWLDTFLRPAESKPHLPPGLTLEQALAEMAQGHQELKGWKDFSSR